MFQKFDSVGTKPYFRASKLKLVPGKLTESEMCLKTESQNRVVFKDPALPQPGLAGRQGS